MPRTSTYLLLAAALLVGLAGGGLAAAAVIDGGGGGGGDAGGPAATDGGTQAKGAPIVQNTSADGDYVALYDATIDSVVTIQAVTDRGTSQGTGFVYDGNGHVVTNEHVVGDSEDVTVRFADGTWREATVVGTDVYTDLAVLEVQSVPTAAEPLPIAATNPETGQRVAALGSPFGLEGTITSGIVSGVNRSMRTEAGFSIPATVQTDAPINPGNSGGPLVSMNGTVVGVNRAKQGDNVGYAISPQVVERVVPGLIRNGSYDHAYVGIGSVPVTPAVAEANGLAQARGVHVVAVVDGGPAEGVLQPADGQTTVNGRTVRTGGDVILAVDGTAIDTQQELSRVLMLQTSPGETISMTVLRDGEETTVEVTLDERPAPSELGDDA